MYAQPYVRHLSGHPRHHRIGGHPPTSSIRTSDHVLATSLVGIPAPMPQNMPMAANYPWATPPAAQSSLVPSQSSFTFDGDYIPSPNIPRAYSWYYPPTQQLLNYTEYQVPVPPVDAPQVYPQLWTPSSQLLGCAEAQVPMPPLCASQGSSYFPCHAPAVYTPSLQSVGYSGGQVPMPPLGAPQGYPQLSAPSLQSPGYAKNQVPMPSLDAPQSYPQLSAPSLQSPGYTENQVPMPSLDAPQSYPQFCTSSLQPLGHAGGQAPMPPLAAPPSYPELCPPSSQLLDGAEDQAPVPPLDAPQDSHLPSPAGQSNENSASAGGHSSQKQESKCADSLPPAPQKKQVAKRKRKASLSTDNDDEQQNPTAPAQAVIPANPTTRKRKKADYDPRECPLCHRMTSRPRRSRTHTRDICLRKRILNHKLSEIAIGQAIKQWGVPDYFLRNSTPILDVKAEELNRFFQKFRERLDKLICRTSDEKVVDVLINEGGLTSMSQITFKTDTNEGSTSQAKPKPSCTRSVLDTGKRGSEIAIKNSTSIEYRMPTPCPSETCETSANSSCPSYRPETAPPANPTGLPSSGAEAQAPLDDTTPFLFGQGGTAVFSFGQNEICAAGLQSDFGSGAIPAPQSESGVGWPSDFILPITDSYEPFPCVYNGSYLPTPEF